MGDAGNLIYIERSTLVFVHVVVNTVKQQSPGFIIDKISYPVPIVGGEE